MSGLVKALKTYARFAKRCTSGCVLVDHVLLYKVISKIEFLEGRCDELQRVQAVMRDPERKMVCDILANGRTFEKPKKDGETGNGD